MCAKTDLKDTLLRILKSKTLLENMEFPTVEQQQNLFHQLQEKRPNFYKDLDPKNVQYLSVRLVTIIAPSECQHNKCLSLC